MEKILTIDEFYKSETLTPAFVNTVKEFEEVIYEMVKIMNHIHETDKSYRFWKLIVIDYVNYKMQRRKILSEKVQEIHENPKDKILKKLVYFYKNLRNFNSLGKIKTALKNYDNIAHGFHDTEIIEKEIGKIIPSYFPIILKSGDKRKRERANKLAESYNDIFYKNLILQLPKTFVEHFDYINSLYPLVNAEKKSFHTSFIESEYIKILISKYIDRGAKLFIYQHGSGGEIKDRSIFHDSSVSDNYITWGWKIDETNIPGKAYRCYGFKKKYEKLTGDKEYDCTMVYSYLSESDKLFFKPITEYILSNIDFNKYKKIVARPRPVNKWRNISSQLDFIKSDKVIIDSGRTSMAEVIYKSKIIIIFTWVWPQTNFSECIYVDHPIVSLVIDMDYTTKFKPYYDFLIEYKVFHETVESLVEHLNNVDIDKWWNELIKHPTYKAFKHEFLREV